MLTLTIPGRLTVTVANLAAASAVFKEAQDKSGEGASTFPNGKIEGAEPGCFVSYNGRVWLPNVNPDAPSHESGELAYCPAWDRNCAGVGTPMAYKQGQESVWGRAVPNPFEIGSGDWHAFEIGAEIARMAYA